jgi:hypothetical protein
MRIGIDFDNTIAGYDELFADLASEQGLFDCAPANKRELRDSLRAKPGGEEKWQRLQAAAYGGRMSGARMFDGVAPFLNACRVAGIEVHIVSHKTRFANYASDGTDLRQAALTWMSEHHFFDPEGFAVEPDHVHFRDTRDAKIVCISDLDCDRFIDDLEEVFAEPAFPAGVERLLFDPAGASTTCNGVKPFRHWDEIREHVFGHRD